MHYVKIDTDDLLKFYLCIELMLREVVNSILYVVGNSDILL
jgi:hypothetical protein